MEDARFLNKFNEELVEKNAYLLVRIDNVITYVGADSGEAKHVRDVFYVWWMGAFSFNLWGIFPHQHVHACHLRLCYRSDLSLYLVVYFYRNSRWIVVLAEKKRSKTLAKDVPVMFG